MKHYYIITVTYNSTNAYKYCELTDYFKGSPESLEKKIKKYYNTNYEDYGKAEAVKVELVIE